MTNNIGSIIGSVMGGLMARGGGMMGGEEGWAERKGGWGDGRVKGGTK